MRSHFALSHGVAAACAVASATTLLNCSAQTFIAADYATNSAYSGGWSAGQNGGYGFGAWSFNGTDPTPTGQYQGISASSPLGTAWTLLTHSNTTGLANAGRAIPGGLQVGQTFETVIDNPTTTHFFRGWGISLINGTDNNPGGVNTGEQVAAYHFEYFNYGQWNVGDLAGNTGTTLHHTDTAVAGMKLDVTLTSTNTYSLTMTPLGGSASPYTQSGTLKTGDPINWIEFQLYNNASSGLNDTANNFEISSMTIRGLTLNIQRDGSNVILSWPTNAIGFSLVSTLNLGPAAVWNPVSPLPAVVNGQNVVTNSIAGSQQFYRLQQ